MDEEGEDYKKKLLEQCKLYSHIDYEDDEEIIILMIDVVIEELKSLIPNFDAPNMTSRQRLLTLISVKELYDNREKYQKDDVKIRNAVSSMLLKEVYGGGTT